MRDAPTLWATHGLMELRNPCVRMCVRQRSISFLASASRGLIALSPSPGYDASVKPVERRSVSLPLCPSVCVHTARVFFGSSCSLETINQLLFALWGESPLSSRKTHHNLASEEVEANRCVDHSQFVFLLFSILLNI